MTRIIAKSIVLPIFLILLIWNCCDAEEQSTAKCQPVKIAVLQDMTGSVIDNDIPILQVNDLDSLIKLLYRCGGELGLGSVSDNSNKRLTRLLIETPPAEPIEPDKKGNPYKAARLLAEYKDQMAKYKPLYAEWTQNNKANIDKFKADVFKILNNKKAKRSDIWGAIERADRFVSENDSYRGLNVNLFVLLITDGKDNVRKTQSCTGLNKNTKYILVPGDSGMLTNLNPIVRFESISSALRYLNFTLLERSK